MRLLHDPASISTSAMMSVTPSGRALPPELRAHVWRVVLLVAACLLPLRAHATCFEEAAQYQHVNPLILRAIAWQESHDHPDAMHVNENGSIDFGLMQINTIHLRALSHYGIDKTALMSPCKAVYIAAWHLRAQMNHYGNTWAAVGAYHSATPALRDDYALRIAAIVDCLTQRRPAGAIEPVAMAVIVDHGATRARRTRGQTRACPAE